MYCKLENTPSNVIGAGKHEMSKKKEIKNTVRKWKDNSLNRKIGVKEYGKLSSKRCLRRTR
jgi:hypothetical protein